MEAEIELLPRRSSVGSFSLKDFILLDEFGEVSIHGRIPSLSVGIICDL